MAVGCGCSCAFRTFAAHSVAMPAVHLQEAEGGALASYTGTLRYSSGLIADQKRTAAALVRISKMVAKVSERSVRT